MEVSREGCPAGENSARANRTVSQAASIFPEADSSSSLRFFTLHICCNLSWNYEGAFEILTPTLFFFIFSFLNGVHTDSSRLNVGGWGGIMTLLGGFVWTGAECRPCVFHQGLLYSD